jgi:aspartyl-tRNA(Asn)/glutamyl-tRNA(Gln) amidotransferase subunit A
MEIIGLKAWEMKEKLINKELSAVEILNAHLTQIDKEEKNLNAFITIDRENALKSAKRVDKKIEENAQLGVLAGIPVGLKDNIMTKGLLTTCASKMLEDFVPPFNATVVKNILDRDGIVLGKTNMDEFAMGGSTETSHFGPTKNPKDTSKVPGGSSGGSAAAVAGFEVPLSLGTDTGGSVRQPASFCGVVGMKPTYGLVSRYGVVPMSNSLDQVGVFGRDVKDAHMMLQGIMGYDPLDATSSKKASIDILLASEESLKGLRIALPKEFENIRIAGDEKIQESFKRAVKRFEDAGANIDYISINSLKNALEAYYIISTAEVSTNLSRLDGIRYGYRTDDYKTLDELYINSRTEAFGEEVKRRIMMGTYALSAGYQDEHYIKALKIRTLVKRDFENLFKNYDIVLSLASPILPYAFDSLINSPVDMYKADMYTVPVNLAGMCALSMPIEEVDGLPVGMQIIGNRFADEKILKTAMGFERAVK